MPAIILPDRWRRQPTGPVELNNGPFAERLSAAALPSSGGIVRTYSRGKLVEQVAQPSGSGIILAGGIGGLGVHAPTGTTHSLRLHSTANQTNTAWEAPSAAGTWLAVFVRYGNAAGHAYIFGNVTGYSSPYSAWGLYDENGTGSLKSDCGAGGSYRENTFGTMSNNLLYVAGGRYNGANLTTFANGVFSTPTACAGSLSYPNDSNRGPALGNFYDYSLSSRSFNGQIYLGLLWDYALSDAEIIELSQNPWQVFKKSARILYFPSAGGGGATITAGSGSFALTGTAVSLKANRVLAAASGSFALTGSDVSLRVGRKLAADSGTYSLTGTDVAFKRGYALSAESGTYTLNGTDVSLKAGRKLTADSGTYALTGTNVTLTHNSAGSYTLVAESGSYSLTGTAVSLTVNRKLAADSGTYALTGSNATLTKGYTLTAASGTYTLTGSNVAFARTYRLTAESGAYTLTGSNASIVWSGAPVDSGPDTSGGGSGPRVLLRERKVREEVDEWLAKKAQADLLKKIQREDEEICLIMALLAA